MQAGYRRTAILIALPLLVLLATSVRSTAAAAGAGPVPAAARSVAAEKERRKVLMTIENRMSDDKALEKMREKLDVLAGRKLRLAAALCDRIALGSDSAGADIAFSLVTALIVLA